MRRSIQLPIWSVVAALVFASFLGSASTWWMRESVPKSLFTVTADARTQMVFDEGFSPILRSAAPAVVNIWSSRIVERPDTMDPFLRKFFNRRERSLGSGVIVNSEGYVLTNHHVIDGAVDVKVAVSGDREVAADVVGTDPPTDIAVLKIRQTGLPALTFGDSHDVEVGDLALAIGNPFGIGQTVTMGIVSAVGRGGLGIEDYEDFIQTDASINPGNSGGALINVRGELIGINTAILGPPGGNLGIGFAIPSNMARSVLEQIMKNGEVVRGWVGIGLVDTPEGVVIGQLAPGSPAEKAGLAIGDLIQEVNGESIVDGRELRLQIGALNPGTQVVFRVSRAGPSRIMTVTLGRGPAGHTAEEPRFH